MTGVVLDASALLAMLLDEPGGDSVSDALGDAVIGAVNWAEVAGSYFRMGASREIALAVLTPLEIPVIDATALHAIAAAELLPFTRAAGLSLGDRFCLALAKAEGRAAMTADRAWAEVGVAVGVEVRVIR